MHSRSSLHKSFSELYMDSQSSYGLHLRIISLGFDLRKTDAISSRSDEIIVVTISGVGDCGGDGGGPYIYI